MKKSIVGFVLLGIVLGIAFTRAYDGVQTVSRKWKAINWVMADYNEEVVYQHLNTQKAVLQLVISKK